MGPRRGWEIRSAGTGSKGHRWYAWAWLGTASARHHLLIRRHLGTGELALPYCCLPEGQPASPARPVRAAGLRSRAALACRRRFRVRKGLLRARPIPGPPLHRDRPAHRAGHGRPGHLRRHRRPAPPPHRHPGARPSTPEPAPARRPGDDPAHRAGNRACSAARPHPAAPSTGQTGGAITRPVHAGTTSEHDWHAASRSPWSGSEWLLPY
jgi:hypothetical protein